MRCYLSEHVLEIRADAIVLVLVVESGPKFEDEDDYDSVASF